MRLEDNLYSGLRLEGRGRMDLPSPALDENNAAAAKLRQVLPAFAAHLRVKGWDVTEIRLRIQA